MPTAPPPQELDPRIAKDFAWQRAVHKNIAIFQWLLVLGMLLFALLTVFDTVNVRRLYPALTPFFETFKFTVADYTVALWVLSIAWLGAAFFARLPWFCPACKQPLRSLWLARSPIYCTQCGARLA